MVCHGLILFILAGNFPLEKHLEFINQHGFDKFKKIEGLPPLPKAVRYEKPVRVKISGPMDPSM